MSPSKRRQKAFKARNQEKRSREGALVKCFVRAFVATRGVDSIVLPPLLRHGQTIPAPDVRVKRQVWVGRDW